EEVRLNIGKAVGAGAARRGVDGSEPSANGCYIERYGCGLIPEADCAPFPRRNQIALARGGKLAVALQGRQHSRQAYGLGGPVRGGISFGSPSHGYPPLGSFGPGPERSREDRG